MPTVESLLEFVAAQPDEPLPRYALAMEYRSSGRLDDAVAAFRELVARRPEYVPTYLMLGQTLIAAGRKSEAREILSAGIEAARAARNNHALGELRDALDDLT